MVILSIILRIFYRFVSGFLWLDKLGLAAASGYRVVIRQTFFHGCYALVGEDAVPNPDYWLSLLHKRLVGVGVLRVTKALQEGGEERTGFQWTKGNFVAQK